MSYLLIDQILEVKFQLLWQTIKLTLIKIFTKKSKLMIQLVVTNGNQKKPLFDLIGQIFYIDTKRENLERLRDFIFSGEEESKSLKFDFVDTSVSKIINKYLPPNPFKQTTTKDIQAKINEIKYQVPTLQTNLLEVKTNTLEIPDNIEIFKEETPNNLFLQVISKILLKNGTALSILKLKISLSREQPLLTVVQTSTASKKVLYQQTIVMRPVKIYVMEMELLLMYPIHLKDT